MCVFLTFAIVMVACSARLVLLLYVHVFILQNRWPLCVQETPLGFIYSISNDKYFLSNIYNGIEKQNRKILV